MRFKQPLYIPQKLDFVILAQEIWQIEGSTE